MSLFRIVDRDGRMVADADNLDGLTKVVSNAPPGVSTLTIFRRSRRSGSRPAGGVRVVTLTWKGPRLPVPAGSATGGTGSSPPGGEPCRPWDRQKGFAG